MARPLPDEPGPKHDNRLGEWGRHLGANDRPSSLEHGRIDHATTAARKPKADGTYDFTVQVEDTGPNSARGTELLGPQGLRDTVIVA